MQGFLRRLATKAIIRAKVALAPQVVYPEGVAPLNPDFFKLQRMRKAGERKKLKG